MENRIRKASKLVEDARKKIVQNEYNTTSLKGVKNISRADLEVIVLYAETFIKNNGTGFRGLMSPLGNIKDVLVKYDIIDKGYKESFW